jgi:predicted DCC family thiol-disulfide oxidoreductase YuxK
MNGSVATASDAAPARLDTTTRLTVLYDERCAFCLRCRDWLAHQPCLVEVELLPAGSAVARERYGAVPWLGSELVVVNDRGQAWVGPAAFIVCLWATIRYRPWSYLLSRPEFSSHTARFFLHVSKRRGRWGEWLGRKDDDCSWCDEVRMRWDV